MLWVFPIVKTRQEYRKPRYDLTIITRMNRGFRPTPDGQLMFKEQNVYACVTVPNWLPHYLTPEHVHFLREFGAQI